MATPLLSPPPESEHDARGSAAAHHGGPAEAPLPEPERALPEYVAELPAWLISMIVHMGLLILLAVSTIGPRAAPGPLLIIGEPGEQDVSDDLVSLDAALDDARTELFEPLESKVDVATTIQNDDILSKSSNAAAAKPSLTDLLGEQALVGGEGLGTGFGHGDLLSGRGSSATKAALLREGGGNQFSEEAVTKALKWLVAHQDIKDGGWSFDHREGGHRCAGRCKNPGTADEARIGATALALLPFLGAGHTPKSGTYREPVRRGLHFLIVKQNPRSGALFEPVGNMYSHGLAAIALAEAYAMTRDKPLHDAAQKALDFVSEAQDPGGGGWRYVPGQSGDTSVVGWQIMALKSGSLSYLRINPDTIRNAARFLDSVSADGGATYGYQQPGDGQATTAIGLLCRMYMGWKRDHETLVRGVAFLDEHGPSKGDMYYNYYATQVLHHVGGEPWKRWNSKMRDQLIASQATRGHEQGSWYMRDRHGDRGGRLYCTALAAMVLEVYYRHLPLYKQDSVDEAFRGE